MQIDARKLGIEELLRKLKEILASQHGCDVDIDILLSTTEDAKKITAFVSMSGCTAHVDKNNNYYIMHISGTICCA